MKDKCRHCGSTDMQPMVPDLKKSSITVGIYKCSSCGKVDIRVFCESEPLGKLSSIDLEKVDHMSEVFMRRTAVNNIIRHLKGDL